MSQSDTRARRAIRAALAEHGMEPEHMLWEGRHNEWEISVRDHGTILALNWRDAIEQIHCLAPAWLDGSLFG